MTSSKATEFPRVCISSTSGGGGKTLLSLGLGRALARMGHTVKPFKKGPDFIDSAWLTKACASRATNLDPFFLTPSGCRALFRETMRDSPRALALVEGNRGLYDGMDAQGSYSTAALARGLTCPILLCIDCAKATRTIAAILRGLLDFEEGLDFCGVVLNKTGSPRHAAAICSAIEKHLDLPVFGSLPRLETNPLPERHMGLASWGAALREDVELSLDRLADFIERHVETDAILKAARNAPELPADAPADCPEAGGMAAQSAGSPRIGYARDDALWFYYPENLKALQAQGARLRELSILDYRPEDWEDLHGLYLGGGFPEDFAEKISQSPALARIASFAAQGMPIYAECGGMIVLCSSLEINNTAWPMAGIFNCRVEWLPRPQGLGYVEIKSVLENPFFPPGTCFRAHEFHYSRCIFGTKAPDFALELMRGNGLARQGSCALDGMRSNRVLAAYAHIFAPAVPCWAPNFVAAARTYQHCGQAGPRSL